MHANSGVEKGMAQGGKPVEIMGMMLGRPDTETPNALIVTDVSMLFFCCMVEAGLGGVFSGQWAHYVCVFCTFYRYFDISAPLIVSVRLASTSKRDAYSVETDWDRETQYVGRVSPFQTWLIFWEQSTWK